MFTADMLAGNYRRRRDNQSMGQDNDRTMWDIGWKINGGDGIESSLKEDGYKLYCNEVLHINVVITHVQAPGHIVHGSRQHRRQVI